MRNVVVFDREGEGDSARAVREKMIHGLLAEWLKIDSMLEERRCRDDYGESWYDVAGEDFIEREIENALDAMKEGEDEKEVIEAARVTAEQKWKDECDKPLVQRNLIEQQLDALGARLARPYEHWNEEEKYVEHLENKYDYRD